MMRSFTITSSSAVFLFLSVLSGFRAVAQKPFTEGVIVYNVTMETADHKTYAGTYTFSIKDGEMKKDLKLSNGYEDVVLLNHRTGSVYSLQTKNGKKYAIQLSLDDLTKKQERFIGYTINNEQANSRNIVGIAAERGDVKYKDGSSVEVYYTKEWYPTQSITYERFPDPKFLPLSFSYKDDNGMITHFEASSVAFRPVENSVFHIPADYKMISYKEYKELSR